jgi:hypothetical protein
MRSRHLGRDSRNDQTAPVYAAEERGYEAAVRLAWRRLASLRRAGVWRLED